ncbi:MAG: ATP-dependent helicase DinG [Thermodesulfobacteriota bacterium]|nr:ATP-dependent helicase DinG [Thermodesulfobacteriota bacterium]
MDPHEAIASIFAPDGILAKKSPGYEYREQQAQMAWEVFQVLFSSDVLLIEAPTGTGKTLAYLAAVALSRRKTAVSTGTKNLQEQLFFKDVPFVQEHLFPQLKVVLLKGRGNFVCHSRVKKFMSQIHVRFTAEPDRLAEIMDWYRTTRKKGQGDRAELAELPEDDDIWPEICSSTETCLGKKCPDKEECFVQRMRARAADSDLMIVNHHLLCSDLAIRERGFGEVIPRYESLIIDEAHGLEDAATKHFGVQLSLFKMLRLVKDTTSELRGQNIAEKKFGILLNAMENDARLLFESLAERTKSQAVSLEGLDPRIHEMRNSLCTKLESLSAMLHNLPKDSEDFHNLARRCEDASSDLKIILREENDGDYACWAERRERQVTVHASPVDVGPIIKSHLYGRVDSIVFTSATLSSNENFEYFKSRLGLDGDSSVREKILPSPFDYSRQTLLFIPYSMPEPNSPEFVDAMVGLLPKILDKTRGRAFVLFTSYRNMEAVYQELKRKLPFRLLVQGAKSKHRLLEEFRSHNGSVLLATSSFWEGVDVQGDALSCVIIDRLPFASPGDPLVAARMNKLKKENKSPFYNFQVPMAVIALKQGLGRLIRTRTDKGVLCILDPRILTKPYGAIFLRSLYSSPLKRDLHEIDLYFSAIESCDDHGEAQRDQDA